jgi:cytidylate kinase
VPIITISRGTLSGGRAVAECLADLLGYPCIGREILQDAAAKLGASADELGETLEAPPKRWARLTEERKTYLLAVQTALAEECVGGELVYHGLAGQFLLRGLPGVFAARLIAPIDMRIQALMGAQHRMALKAAEDFIRTVDEDRRRWVKLMYDADVEDPDLYDLTVNLQSISHETACKIIGEAAAQPQFAITPDVTQELERFAARCRQELQRIGEG